MSLNFFPRYDYPGEHIEVARTAAILGEVLAGVGFRLAQGALVRSPDRAVELGARSAFLENGVIIGSAAMPVRVGQKTVFGHRCLLVGANVGDLCEIGNSSILMPGATVGSRCFLGEGTLIPPGVSFPDDSVVVGRPGRLVRRASAADLQRLSRLRAGNVEVPDRSSMLYRGRLEAGANVGMLYSFREKRPAIAPSAVLFETTEITGDVIVGDGSIIGAGVKIIGDSHGPVRIGRGVQILENTVLHLLPDNELVVEDGVVIGPGAMIHGCHLGEGTVVEPGAIVCDSSRVGRNCLVRAGAVLKQRSVFADGSIIDGFPAAKVGTVGGPQELPRWALSPGELPELLRMPRSPRPPSPRA